MIPSHSCSVPGRKPGHVDERDERDVERVAGADEAPGLDRGVDVEHAGERRAAGCRPRRPSARRAARSPQTMFSANRSCTSRNSPSSTTWRMTSLMSYGFVGSSGIRVSSSGDLAVARVGRLRERRPVEVVLRQEREQVARVLEARLLVGRGEVRDARLRRVGGRAAELLERHLLAGHRLHHVGAGDEHVRRALDHEDEVGDRGRVDGAARARPHHERDLRHDARRLHVPPEDLRVPGERDDALLDPRAARVVDPDHRAAELDRQVHHLADLLGEDLATATRRRSVKSCEKTKTLRPKIVP